MQEHADFLQSMHEHSCSLAANTTFITGKVQEMCNKLDEMDKKLNELTDRQTELAWAIKNQGSTAPSDDGAKR